MKTLLVALNASYIHSSLAIRYLYSYCKDEFHMEMLETTVNTDPDKLLGKIYLHKADIVAFSCYIWNIETVIKVAQNLKEVAPATKIVLGGPEVSFGGDRIVAEYPWIDHIVCGEGEISFYNLLKQLDYNKKYSTTREIPRVIDNPVTELESIPSPYVDGLHNLHNKIAYFEASRGCPFNCAYCLSSVTKGVKKFPLERIKRDLDKLIAAGVKQVKFVDRTFNADKRFATEIWSYLQERVQATDYLGTNFHFEISAHLLDQECISFLQKVPSGLFQFEIGVQSTNSETLKNIERTTNNTRLTKVVSKLKEGRNIHLHLDLIAGLPEESYQVFGKSFNDVIGLKPDMLQLGFLKLLKGSALRENATQYQYSFRKDPPYQVLANKDISFDQLLRLQKIEELVGKYYNTHLFQYTIDYLLFNAGLWSSPFEFFQEMSIYWEKQGYYERGIKETALYSELLVFCQVHGVSDNSLKELLKFDFVRSHKVKQLPDWCEQIALTGLKEKINLLKKERGHLTKQNVQYQIFNAKNIPMVACTSPERELVIILFDYSNKELFGGASWEIIEYL